MGEYVFGGKSTNRQTIPSFVASVDVFLVYALSSVSWIGTGKPCVVQGTYS